MCIRDRDNKDDGLDIQVSASQRTATNHDRCKTPNPEPRISSLFNQSAPLTKSNSVTPVFSNLYKTSTPFNAFLTTNPFQTATKLLGPTPVSYTHLDVYKRQAHMYR